MYKNRQRKLLSAGSALALGFLTLAIQVILIREVLQVFLGNELTIGLSLAIWLFGTSIGALIIPGIIRSEVSWHRLIILLLPVTIVTFFLIQVKGVAPFWENSTRRARKIDLEWMAFLQALIPDHDFKAAGGSSRSRVAETAECPGAVRHPDSRPGGKVKHGNQNRALRRNRPDHHVSRIQGIDPKQPGWIKAGRKSNEGDDPNTFHGKRLQKFHFADNIAENSRGCEVNSFSGVNR